MKAIGSIFGWVFGHLLSFALLVAFGLWATGLVRLGGLPSGLELFGQALAGKPVQIGEPGTTATAAPTETSGAAPNMPGMPNIPSAPSGSSGFTLGLNISSDQSVKDSQAQAINAWAQSQQEGWKTAADAAGNTAAAASMAEAELASQVADEKLETLKTGEETTRTELKNQAELDSAEKDAQIAIAEANAARDSALAFALAILAPIGGTFGSFYLFRHFNNRQKAAREADSRAITVVQSGQWTFFTEPFGNTAANSMALVPTSSQLNLTAAVGSRVRLFAVHQNAPTVVVDVTGGNVITPADVSIAIRAFITNARAQMTAGQPAPAAPPAPSEVLASAMKTTANRIAAAAQGATSRMANVISPKSADQLTFEEVTREAEARGLASKWAVGDIKGYLRDEVSLGGSPNLTHITDAQLTRRAEDLGVLRMFTVAGDSTAAYTAAVYETGGSVVVEQ